MSRIASWKRWAWPPNLIVENDVSGAGEDSALRQDLGGVLRSACQGLVDVHGDTGLDGWKGEFKVGVRGVSR